MNEDSIRLLQELKIQQIPGMRLISVNSNKPIRIIDFGERPFDCYDAEDELNFKWHQQPEQSDGGPFEGPYIPDLEDPATFFIFLSILAKSVGLDPTHGATWHRINEFELQDGNWVLTCGQDAMVIGAMWIDDPIEALLISITTLMKKK